MGGICPCCDKDSDNDDTETVNQTTHLLSPPGSSRPHLGKGKENLDSDRRYQSILLKMTGIEAVDRAFLEQQEEVNKLVLHYGSLEDTRREILKQFKQANMVKTSVESCIEAIANLCKGTCVDLARTHKYCIFVSFNEEELISKLGDIASRLVIPCLQRFNRLNEVLRDTQSQCSCVERSLVELFQQEVILRKNIMNADTGPYQEPEALRNCVVNLNLLRRCYGDTRTIHSELDENWNNIVNSYRTFCE
ncbi:uncharacterized protein LOC115227797 [Argonauta hians]